MTRKLSKETIQKIREDAAIFYYQLLWKILLSRLNHRFSYLIPLLQLFHFHRHKFYNTNV